MIMSQAFKDIYISVSSNFISTTQNIIKVFDDISEAQKQAIKEYGAVNLIIDDINNFDKQFASIKVIDGVLKEINFIIKKASGSIGLRKTDKLSLMPLAQSIEALEEYLRTPQTIKINKSSKIEDSLSEYQKNNDFSFDISRITDGKKAIDYNLRSFYQLNKCDVGAEPIKTNLLRSLDSSILPAHQCTIKKQIIFLAIENLDWQSLVILSAWFELGVSTQNKDFYRAVQTEKGFKRSNDKRLYMRAYRKKNTSLKNLVKKIIEIQLLESNINTLQ
jgi:hypothetical protein